MKVGILGGGQLGRMLALAGYPLGLSFRFLDPLSDCPAHDLGQHIIADFEDTAALDEFAAGLDCVTYEFENVPLSAACRLAERLPVWPPPAALAVAQERLAEKTFFRRLGIPTPRFAAVDSRTSFDQALQSIGLPAVLKTRRFGYDGKGQFLLRSGVDIEPAWAHLGGRPLIYEAFVSFRREISMLAVRGRNGDTRFYAPVENVHREGMLRFSRPLSANEAPEVREQAEQHTRRALEELEYVGVLAVEFFELEGRLLANEMAPRVHNSGHWTIEGARTSQFANHIRAVVGLPLGDTATLGFCAMQNLISTTPSPAVVLTCPGVHLHLYGKAPRPGRKLGHITICAESVGELNARLQTLAAIE